MASLRNGIFAFSYKITQPLFNQLRTAFVGLPITNPTTTNPVTERQYETSRDAAEWQYVERLLNKSTVPPYIVKKEFPSGWLPPKDSCLQLPYYIERTKNHMIPLYLANEDRGQRKITKLKKIQGDIWMLHADLKKHVEEMHGKKVASQVLECNSVIKFKGDYFHYVEQFLLAKGF